MDFIVLAQECAPGVAHQTLAAIVKTESAFKPLAIGINGRAKLPRHPDTKEKAVATAKWLIANGYNIDLGLGQVNSANLRKTGLTIEDAFDPCRNLAASASILRWNYEAAKRQISNDQQALNAALSMYNTGSFTRGFNNGYVRRVQASAGQVVPPIRVGVAAANEQASAGRPSEAQPAQPPTWDVFGQARYARQHGLTEIRRHRPAEAPTPAPAPGLAVASQPAQLQPTPSQASNLGSAR